MKKREMLYTLPQRQIPLENTWDVIVVGGGSAGCMAATAAAREGGRTLLIEATGCLGGRSTAGLVPVWGQFSDQEKLIYRGLAQRVFESVKCGMPHIDPADLDGVPIDVERLKRVYDDLVSEGGATILFNTRLSGVDVNEAGAVTAIIVSNISGLTAYQAKVYVDCTGEANLAAWAGAECLNENDRNALQPATLCFVLTNVDDYGYHYGPIMQEDAADSPLTRILKTGRYPLLRDSQVYSLALIGPGTVGVSAGHLWNVEQNAPVKNSQALIQGRKVAEQMRQALAEAYPAAFANAYLAATGALLEIRETRRIVGDYLLTLEDYFSQSIFEDEICRNSYWLDLHCTAEELTRLEPVEIEKRRARYAPGESYGIPYRCLTPQGLTNVLVTGAAISCERSVQGSVRAIPACLAMGEAAGMAAAQASTQGEINVHTLDIEFLRQRLRAEGAYFL